MPRLDEDLATDLSYYQLLRRQRVITTTEFEREKKKLVKKQEKRDEERERRERSLAIGREIAKREAEIKAKRAAAVVVRREKRALGRIRPLFNEVVGDEPLATIIRAYHSIPEAATVRIVFPHGDFTVNGRGRSSKDFVRNFWFQGSDSATLLLKEGERLMVIPPTPIDRERIIQHFRDGVSHCVFTPILAKLKDTLEGSKSKDTQKRIKQRIVKVNALAEKFEEGVPETEMEAVAKASGYKIMIHDILGRVMNTYNEHGRLGVVRFTNTRQNHLDLGELALDQDATLVSERELVKIWKKLDKDGEFYMIEGDLKNDMPRKIRTLEKVFEIEDPNREYFKAMNEAAGLDRCRFNATAHPDVNEFIKAGRIINAWVTPFSSETPTGHLDMPKAYAQFKRCSQYAGFLGVVHQWRTGVFDAAFLRNHIGIYRMRVVRNTNPLFQKLGLSGTHILPSVEILYFLENGVEAVIDAGVWGSRIDFDFTPDMLEDRRYCLWSGRLGMERHSRAYSFKSSAAFASHIKSDYGDNCFYWSDRKICTVRVPIENVFTTHHIFAFLTSYVRIQMMEAMSRFPLENLVKVVMDGIYFRGAQPKGLDWFVPKPIKEHTGGFGWYDCDELCEIDWTPAPIVGNTLLTGQGGAGKTFKILTDGGFNKILFVSPSHLLGADVREKYGVSYTTIHKLIGEDCRAWIEEHSYPPVLFIDEITQIPSSWIERVFKLYPLSLVILAGDVNEKGQWFQCRNGKPGDFSTIWKPAGVDVVCITGDRRSRDDELRECKLKIRAAMERYFIDGDQGEDIVMTLWAKKHFKLTPFDEACEMFQTGDAWIAGTNRTSEKLLAKGVVSGWYKKGGFVSFEEREGYERRGSFTIHSFQGRTLETGKIFISLGDMFEYAMLYTAVSRAVSFSQLVFVA